MVEKRRPAKVRQNSSFRLVCLVFNEKLGLYVSSGIVPESFFQAVHGPAEVVAVEYIGYPHLIFTVAWTVIESGGWCHHDGFSMKVE